MVKDRRSDHQIELRIGAKLPHRHEAASWVSFTRNRDAVGGRIAADYFGPRKEFAQVRHAAANAATEIKHGIHRADQLPSQLDLVAGEVAAVAIEKICLRGDDRLIPAGILIEVDARHEVPPGWTGTRRPVVEIH